MTPRAPIALRSTARWLWAGIAVYAAIFPIYAERWAFAWDESFHLLAAQLINSGKRPYIDFVFPQTPLNAYFSAFWMRLLGENWRVPHFFAALFTIGSVVLTSLFVLRRTAPEWAVASASMAAVLTALNAQIFGYAPLAQAYGICLFALSAALHTAIRAVDDKRLWTAAATGFFAAIAAASSLLAAAAGPIFFLWVAFANRSGNRSTKLAAFLAGAVIPFAPVIWLAVNGPRQAWFNLIQYQASFRRLYWPNATHHDFEVLTSWLRSGQALLILALAAIGLIRTIRTTRRKEFYLCAGLALALGSEAAVAHPTFPQYFLLTIPFLAVLAAAGLEAFRRHWLVVPIVVFMALTLAKSLYDDRDAGDWSAYERLARKIAALTPPNAQIFADEPIYFLLHRQPPAGLEMAYSHRIDLGPQQNALLHIVPIAELQNQLRSGAYATAYSCFESDIALYHLSEIFQNREDTDECSIFWNPRRSR